jgi:hypothetical protein
MQKGPVSAAVSIALALTTSSPAFAEIKAAPTASSTAPEGTRVVAEITNGTSVSCSVIPAAKSAADGTSLPEIRFMTLNVTPPSQKLVRIIGSQQIVRTLATDGNIFTDKFNLNNEKLKPEVVQELRSSNLPTGTPDTVVALVTAGRNVSGALQLHQFTGSNLDGSPYVLSKGGTYGNVSNFEKADVATLTNICATATTAFAADDAVKATQPKQGGVGGFLSRVSGTATNLAHGGRMSGLAVPVIIGGTPTTLKFDRFAVSRDEVVGNVNAALANVPATALANPDRPAAQPAAPRTGRAKRHGNGS